MPSNPRFLYKYRTTSDETLAALDERKVWYASAPSFNDPFDTRSAVRKRDVKEFIKSLGPGASLAGNIDDLYEELMQRFDSVIARRVSIFCMNQHCNHPLMWAHYADGHRGFCLEFQRDAGSRLESFAMAVRYRKKYRQLLIDDVSPPTTKAMEKILLRKSRDWRYEKEWRDVMGKPAGLQSFPGKLTGIIFGARMQDDETRRLRRMFEADHVTFRRAYLSRKRYKVQIR